MSALAGRKVIVSLDGSPIAACHTKTLTMNKEPIDITTGDDDAWRTLLSGDPASRTVEFKVDGIAKSTTLMNQILNNDELVTLTVDMPGLGNYEGDFMMTTLELGAPHDNAVKFSASFVSSGIFDATST